VRHDDGLYRQMRCQKPGTWFFGFDITTWPGYLAISGDMGCYVFARLPDMFEFFAHHKPLDINPDYWAEKVEASDRNGEIREYSREKFDQSVRDYLRSYFDPGRPPRELLREIRDRVLPHGDDGEHEAMKAAMDFESDAFPHFRFHDFYEYSLRDFSHRYLWCCYAISWAVGQYRATAIKVET
jgi:hypothetical protein